ncbi:hypothetical protein V1283_004030 [Bradyrhizobium sp. AZCC 2262]
MAFVWAVAFISWCYYRRTPGGLAVGVATLFASVAFFLPARYVDRRSIGLYLGIFLMFAAMGIGADQTRSHLSESTGQKIETTDGPLTASVIRSGERGLLLFDVNSQRFLFKKWEAVKEIDWRRTPCLGSDNSP